MSTGDSTSPERSAVVTREANGEGVIPCHFDQIETAFKNSQVRYTSQTTTRSHQTIYVTGGRRGRRVRLMPVPLLSFGCDPAHGKTVCRVPARPTPLHPAAVFTRSAKLAIPSCGKPSLDVPFGNELF
jgi:hypothetical protein